MDDKRLPYKSREKYLNYTIPLVQMRGVISNIYYLKTQTNNVFPCEFLKKVNAIHNWLAIIDICFLFHYLTTFHRLTKRSTPMQNVVYVTPSKPSWNVRHSSSTALMRCRLLSRIFQGFIEKKTAWYYYRVFQNYRL